MTTRRRTPGNAPRQPRTSAEAPADDLEQMRLPELQALVHELTGEPTRSPNKRYLFRVIRDARQRRRQRRPSSNTTNSSQRGPTFPPIRRRAGSQAAPSQMEEVGSDPAPNQQSQTPPTEPAAPEESEATLAPATQAARPSEDFEALANDPDVLKSLPIPKLQRVYENFIGRTTSSTNRDYLLWKLGQARKGNIRRGPSERGAGGTPQSLKVVPLRIETETLIALDAASRRLQIPNRMTLFRRALADYLHKQGEAEVAALFEPAARSVAGTVQEPEDGPSPGVDDVDGDEL